jgi:hypothetical protein
MRHDPKFVATIAKLLPVLHGHRPLQGMNFEQLCDYLAYFWNHGTMSCAFDDLDKPVGVCLIKLFAQLDGFLDEFIHQPEGEFCMIVLLVADTPNVMEQLCAELVSRWGTGWTMLWDRGTRTEAGAPRMFRWDQFEKITRRLTYGLIENAPNV